MRLPHVTGTIDRRILANYRVDPNLLAKLLPKPFCPQLVNGFGVAGICLIRLKHIRPVGLPRWCGISSENAAHRFAVEWEVNGQRKTGVFVSRRDTNSIINTLAGGRVFPGVHKFASFDVQEDDSSFHVGVKTRDASMRLSIDCTVAAKLPDGSIFQSAEYASRFFEQGSLGYSPAATNDRFDGLELKSHNWIVHPVDVQHIESSHFDDRSIFPAASIQFDHALLMRGIQHEWRSREAICCPSVH